MRENPFLRLSVVMLLVGCSGSRKGVPSEPDLTLEPDTVAEPAVVGPDKDEAEVRRITAALRGYVAREQFPEAKKEAPAVEAHLTRACRGGNGAACHALGRFFSLVPAKVFALTVDPCDVEKRGCELNCVDSCSNLLSDIRYRRCGSDSEERRRAYAEGILARLDGLCTAGRWRACDALYRKYRWEDVFAGKEMDRDNVALYRHRFLDTAEAACEQRDAVACEKVGVHWDRDARDAPENDLAVAFYAKATRIREEGCERQILEDCQWLAALWSQGNDKTRGDREPDRQLAATYAYQACELGDISSCLTAGEIWTQDVLAPVVDGVVRPVENGLVEGWGTLEKGVTGIMVPPSEQVFAKGKTAMDRACDEGLSGACWHLAMLHLRPDAPWKNEDLAQEYYRRTRELLTPRCEGGYGGCQVLSFLVRDGDGGPLDMRLYQHYVELDCEQGNDHACPQAARLCANGFFTPASPERAREHLERVCTENTTFGCVPLGYMYETGKGGEKNLETALELYRKGCTDIAEDGCEHVERLTGKPARPDGQPPRFSDER